MRFDAPGRHSTVAFDPMGLVFAAAISGGRVKLFDVRAYDKGPFLTFTPDISLPPVGPDGKQPPRSFSGLKFSNDGKLILLSSCHGVHALLDSFKGGLLRTFSGHSQEGADGAEGVPLEACFSPDSEYVLCGGADGAIWRYRSGTGQALPPLREHNAPVKHIRCNPTRMLLACGDGDGYTSLWLPEA